MKINSRVALVLALLLSAGMAHSASNRGAKGYKTVVGNTTAVLLGGIPGTATTGNYGQRGPVTLYGVIMSTNGLTGSDFLLIRDSNTANSTSSLALPPIPPTLNLNGGMLTFDPPILLQNGASVGLSVGVDTATVIWEEGRATGF